jgi:hypothetical protein
LDEGKRLRNSNGSGAGTLHAVTIRSPSPIDEMWPDVEKLREAPFFSWTGGCIQT